jgi:hypothetical protein
VLVFFNSIAAFAASLTPARGTPLLQTQHNTVKWGGGRRRDEQARRHKNPTQQAQKPDQTTLHARAAHHVVRLLADHLGARPPVGDAPLRHEDLGVGCW